MTINERIRQLRKEELGMNMEQFGKLLGLSKSGVSEIESGRRNVTEQHIQMLTLKAVNGLIITGPTGTNVNDLYLGLLDDEG